MADDRTFVIIGASLAGARAAAELRSSGFTGQVVLVGEETENPYERPPLSKAHLLGQPADVFVQPPSWYADNGVTVRKGMRATLLDPGAHSVTLDGYETLHYDKLLLACGARVRTLDVPGGQLPGVRYLRTLDESDALRSLLSERPRVVVIGAGWIGLEAAAAARQYGAAVTVVEQESLPLARVLGPTLGQIFADLHDSHGVAFRFGVGVSALLGDSSVTGVALSDGSELPADVVIVGIGVRPNMELASSAGLEVDDGVVVDSQLRTSDPDIYACGDLASWPSARYDRRLRVEHWDNARKSGDAAARSMLGNDTPYDPVPYFFSDQYDFGMEFCGLVDGSEQVVFRGDVGKREFLAFWLADDRLVAAMNANIWDVTDQLQSLVRAGTRVDPERLADPAVPLDGLAG